VRVRRESNVAVALATNDEAKCLELRDVDVFGDSLQCQLRVRSEPFSVVVRAEFDNLRTAVEELRRMHANLAGDVRLGAAYQDTFVVFSMNNRGQLKVSGVIITDDELRQRLDFSFVTDQTALPSFIGGLGAALGQAAG
jgi:hypothetical protein